MATTNKKTCNRYTKTRNTSIPVEDIIKSQGKGIKEEENAKEQVQKPPKAGGS